MFALLQQICLPTARLVQRKGAFSLSFCFGPGIWFFSKGSERRCDRRCCVYMKCVCVCVWMRIYAMAGVKWKEKTWQSSVRPSERERTEAFSSPLRPVSSHSLNWPFVVVAGMSFSLSLVLFLSLFAVNLCDGQYFIPS